MASNHTANIHLSQWEENDEVLRTDFNADNAKIDAALAALETDLEAAAAEAESGIAAVSAAVAQCGNCIAVTGSYTGTGKYGEDSPNRLYFSHKPMAVFLESVYILTNGQSSTQALDTSSRYILYFTWGERSVSWYSTSSAIRQCNSAITYRYIAFLDKEN